METMSNQFNGSLANTLKVGHANIRAMTSNVKNALHAYSMTSRNNIGRVTLCFSETFNPSSDMFVLT